MPDVTIEFHEVVNDPREIAAYDPFHDFEPGQIYVVPAVHNTPIIGTKHSDSGYGVEVGPHYHIDNRFTDEIDETRVMAVGDIQYQRRLCIRATHHPINLPKFLMGLYLAFGKRKSACGHCPHRGMPILNGKCSGHGLEFNTDGLIKYKPPYKISLRALTYGVIGIGSNGRPWSCPSLVRIAEDRGSSMYETWDRKVQIKVESVPEGWCHWYVCVSDYDNQLITYFDSPAQELKVDDKLTITA